MIYIPHDWIKNKDNEPEVRALILDCLGCFRFDDDDTQIKAENRLKELGEDTILKELKKGAFAM